MAWPEKDLDGDYPNPVARLRAFWSNAENAITSEPWLRPWTKNVHALLGALALCVVAADWYSVIRGASPEIFQVSMTLLLSVWASGVTASGLLILAFSIPRPVKRKQETRIGSATASLLGLSKGGALLIVGAYSGLTLQAVSDWAAGQAPESDRVTRLRFAIDGAEYALWGLFQYLLITICVTASFAVPRAIISQSVADRVWAAMSVVRQLRAPNPVSTARWLLQLTNPLATFVAWGWLGLIILKHALI